MSPIETTLSFSITSLLLSWNKYTEYDVIEIADQMNRSDLLFLLFIACRGEGIRILEKKE